MFYEFLKRRLTIDIKLRVNYQIKTQEVRVIDEENNNLGIINLDSAIKMAQEKGLDLIEVSPNANPPVCKIMDVGKLKYEMKKKLQAAKKRQHIVEIKEIKFHPKIDKHDYEVKKGHIRRFLTDGKKVKVTMILRGREIVYSNNFIELMHRLIKDVEDVGKVESSPQSEGRFIIMMLSPLKRYDEKKGGENAENKNA